MLLQLWPFVVPVHIVLSYLCGTADLELKKIKNNLQTLQSHTAMKSTQSLQTCHVQHTRLRSVSSCWVSEWAVQRSLGLCLQHGAELSGRRIGIWCDGWLPCPVGTGVYTSPVGMYIVVPDVPAGKVAFHWRSWCIQTKQISLDNNMLVFL